MSSELIQEKADERPPLRGGPGEPGREVAPSVLRQDDLTLPRIVGGVGGAILCFIAMTLVFRYFGLNTRVLPTGLVILGIVAGIGGLLFHAGFEREGEYRFIYFGLAYVLLAVGAFLCFLPYPKQAGDQFRYAIPCLGLSLVFFLTVLRNEPRSKFRQTVELGLLGIGLVAAGVAFIGSNFKSTFFLPHGLVLALLGLVYLAAFVGTRGISDDLGYRVGLGLGVIGALVLIVALVRTFLPAEPGVSYFKSYGFLLCLVAMLYLAVGLMLVSDSTLVILTRRELGSFFYSPIAYLVLFGFVLLFWLPYAEFLSLLFAPVDNPQVGGPLEPIVQNYVFHLYPVIVLIFAVPALTMRLLSEEQRSGTLEVMLTAPVSETALVFSKFLAALMFFLISWVPFGLYLLALPLAGANPFDYRPLLSFLIGLTVTGAGFVAMGLFCSSLTRNQIASGVMCFAGMLILTSFFMASGLTQDAVYRRILQHMSYLQVYRLTLDGQLVPGSLLFFLSLAIFFLFLTVKVMESRRWS